MTRKSDRRWTLLVVPHGAAGSRAVEISQAVLKTAIGLGTAVTIVFLLLGGAALLRGVNISRGRTLERENAVLTGEIQHLRDQLAVLSDTVSAVGEREQALRLLAGLEPTDPGVQAGGIGGPAGDWSGRDSLAAAGSTGSDVLRAREDVDALIRRASILANSVTEAYDSLSSRQARYAATPSIMPTEGWLTSAFARERVHPILHLARPHEGIDVTAPMGAAIEAPGAGLVTKVEWVDGYGNMLTIDHGYGVVTRYAHCSKILVARGQRVKRGQTIAYVGSTGLASGPHLHYEVWVNSKPVNPMRYVLPDAIVD